MVPEKKLFVLDTNVLLHDPESLFAFGEHSIVLPITVLEELDAFKTAKGELGKNARKVIRTLDRLLDGSGPIGVSRAAFGMSVEGVSLGEGLGELYLAAENSSFRYAMLPSTSDNYILGTAHQLTLSHTSAISYVVLVTKDIGLRIKAKSLGLLTQDYFRLKSDTTGIGGINEVTALQHEDFIALSKGMRVSINKVDKEIISENHFCIVFDTDGKGSLLARTVDGHLCRVEATGRPSGIKPRNAEQRFLVDALMNPEIDAVVCNGVAGTGKTLLSLACGIQSMSDGLQHSMLITKAIMPVGNDIGYLKGTKEEKVKEWLKPYYDNLEYISMVSKRDAINNMLESGKIEIDALTYIRGRSLMHRFVIVDECQNLLPGQIKTIVTRIAAGSKLVLLGDIQQIDNPYLDLKDNGLAYAMARLNGLRNIAVLNLVKSERGRLATQGIELL